MDNRAYAHKLWLKQHGNKEEYKKVLKRRKHLNEVGGLIEIDDWRGGVRVYEK